MIDRERGVAELLEQLMVVVEFGRAFSAFVFRICVFIYRVGSPDSIPRRERIKATNREDDPNRSRILKGS
uniref:Uncharacterized protein n=1 Tax=Salix viminalis TaxID=40686 RepID=A0A6N2MU00_SALVM